MTDQANGVVWHYEADIVVVGFGGAGAAAALEAVEGGASVIAIDRFDGGGATAMSGGVIYAGDTSIQKAAGVEDTIEEMAKYLALEIGSAVSPETIIRYCRESGPTLDWLIGLGVPYSPILYPEKTIYPPDGSFLYYSGNEKVPEFKKHAKPAARGHRPVGPGMSGNVFYDALKAAATRRGVKLITHSPVTRLITDAQGRVVGVEIAPIAEADRARHAAIYNEVAPMKPFNSLPSEKAVRTAKKIESATVERKLVRARKGVVLSTGGFSYNVDMLGEQSPFFAGTVKTLMRMGSLGDDGSAVTLGRQVGAATKGMTSFYVGRNVSPPPAFLQGILVNAKGERFINETAYVGAVGRAIGNQPDGVAWLVIDSGKRREAVKQALFGGWMFLKFYGVPALLNILFGGSKSASSAGKLAKKCGMDPAALQASVDAYNAAATAGQGDPVGKASEYTKPLSGKLHALNFSITNLLAFTQFFTLGGLSVAEDDGAVLRTDGSRIEGLYAAGRSAYGLCSNGYISGLSIGDCVFTGRRAARSLLQKNAPLTQAAS